MELPCGKLRSDGQLVERENQPLYITPLIRATLNLPELCKLMVRQGPNEHLADIVDAWRGLHRGFPNIKLQALDIL